MCQLGEIFRIRFTLNIVNVLRLRRQRRLFDDTKEGEKVMTLLTSLSPGDLANMLHPILIQVNKLNHKILKSCVANCFNPLSP